MSYLYGERANDQITRTVQRLERSVFLLERQFPSARQQNRTHGVFFWAKTVGVTPGAADEDTPGQGQAKLQPTRTPGGTPSRVVSDVNISILNPDPGDIADGAIVPVLRTTEGFFYVIPLGASPFSVAKSTSLISARVGDTPGQGTYAIWTRDVGGDYAATATTGTLYNPFAAEIPNDTYLVIATDGAGDMELIGADCPPDSPAPLISPIRGTTDPDSIGDDDGTVVVVDGP